MYSDTCTNLTNNEVRQPNQKPKSPQYEKPYKSKPAAAKSAMAAGKAAVMDGLRDPSSAQFKNVFTHNDFFVCGEVNAKNGMGGYVGFKRFVSMGIVGLVKYDDGSEEFSDYWLTSCKGVNKSWIDEVRKLQKN